MYSSLIPVFVLPGCITLLISLTCPVSQGLSEREPVASSPLGSLRKCANCPVVKPLSTLCMFNLSLSIFSYVVLSFLSSSACCDLSSRLCVEYAALWISGCPRKQRMYHPAALWPVNYNLCVNLEIMAGMMGEWERSADDWMKMWREVEWTSEVREHVGVLPQSV